MHMSQNHKLSLTRELLTDTTAYERGLSSDSSKYSLVDKCAFRSPREEYRKNTARNTEVIKSVPRAELEKI